jgi:hypothetical protein
MNILFYGDCKRVENDIQTNENHGTGSSIYQGGKYHVREAVNL